MAGPTQRLDNFTDAAFAFSVSLLVIGGAGAPASFDQLLKALGEIPAFAFGFAIILLFWMGHVRWRVLRGGGANASLYLTLLLVFLVLIYIQPLRAMAAATGLWFTGQGEGFRGSLTGLFAVYGTGFVAMSLTMAALFTDVLRQDLDVAQVRTARGERVVWLILAITGIVSILVSRTPYGPWAAMIYATLPVSIGIFSARYDWTGARRTETNDSAT
jgi:uncharacterized membrane protein